MKTYHFLICNYQRLLKEIEVCPTPLDRLAQARDLGIYSDFGWCDRDQSHATDHTVVLQENEQNEKPC